MIRRFRDAGLLLDAQLLLLLLVGEFDQQRVMQFKRTHSETALEDLRLLRWLLTPNPRLVVTPQILTEVDDFAKGIHPADFFRLWLRAEVMPRLTEQPIRSHKAMLNPGFPRLGFADASAIQVAREHRLVVTSDTDLYIELTRQQLPVLNFNHLRYREMGLEAMVAQIFAPASRDRTRNR